MSADTGTSKPVAVIIGVGRGTIAMGRIGRVPEVAKTAAFLLSGLSDNAGYITGRNIRVNGDLTRHV